jgi:hypothetical protein
MEKLRKNNETELQNKMEGQSSRIEHRRQNLRTWRWNGN